MELREVLHFYKGKRIFLTGHTGFKGSWLLYLLDSVGAKVTGYSLAPHTTPSLFNSLKFSNNITSITGDIRNKKEFQNAFNECKPEFVFHMAAQPLVLESYKNPKETFDTNFTGTLNLLEILKEYHQKVQAVFITTDKVYENLEIGFPFVETDKLGGKDPYSASKAASEILIDSYVKSFFEDSHVSIASARAGNVIGGGDWSENRLIPDIIRAKIADKPLIIRSPKAVRPWQHVLEPLFGYLKLAKGLYDNPKLNIGPWNFGPENKDIKTVEDIIHIGRKFGILGDVVIKESSLIEAECLMLNITKAKQRLNFRPIWNSKEAIEKTFNWYLNYNKGSINANKLIESDIKAYLNTLH
jgi:CDP-glucose 4,6-dehydratase